MEGLVKRLATHGPAEPAALSAALGWSGRSEEEVGELVEAVQQTLEVLAEVAEQAGPRGRPFGSGGSKPGAAEEGAAAAAGGAAAEGAAGDGPVPMQVDQAADGQPAEAAAGQPAAAPAAEGVDQAAGATEAGPGKEQAGAAGSSRQVVTDPAELVKLVQARVAVPPVCAKALLAPAMVKVLARQARAHVEAIKEHAAVAAKRQADSSYNVPYVPTKSFGLPHWCAAALPGLLQCFHVACVHCAVCCAHALHACAPSGHDQATACGCVLCAGWVWHYMLRSL